MCTFLGLWAIVATGAVLWTYREQLRGLIARWRGGR